MCFPRKGFLFSRQNRYFNLPLTKQPMTCPSCCADIPSPSPQTLVRVALDSARKSVSPPKGVLRSRSFPFLFSVYFFLLFSPSIFAQGEYRVQPRAYVCVRLWCVYSLTCMGSAEKKGINTTEPVRPTHPQAAATGDDGGAVPDCPGPISEFGSKNRGLYVLPSKNKWGIFIMYISPPFFGLNMCYSFKPPAFFLGGGGVGKYLIIPLCSVVEVKPGIPTAPTCCSTSRPLQPTLPKLASQSTKVIVCCVWFFIIPSFLPVWEVAHHLCTPRFGGLGRLSPPPAIVFGLEKERRWLPFKGHS